MLKNNLFKEELSWYSWNYQMANITKEPYMKSNYNFYLSPWNKKIEVINVELDEEI